MSTPADVPHLRPAGSSPQLRITFGAGFGSPSPVMGFPIFDCASSVFALSPVSIEAVKRNTAPAPNMESRIRGVDMAPPGRGEARLALTIIVNVHPPAASR